MRTSSILPPRRDLAPCSPMTQENASTMFDLPDPFGPTTHVMPGSNRRVVAEAKDLNPRRVRVFRYTCELSSSSGRWPPGTPSRERAVVRSLRTLPPQRALLVSPSPLRRDELPAGAAPRSQRADNRDDRNISPRSDRKRPGRPQRDHDLAAHPATPTRDHVSPLGTGGGSVVEGAAVVAMQRDAAMRRPRS